jgi:hypothetical protein
MYQIQQKKYTTGVAVSLTVTVSINGDSGSVWYQLLDANNGIVTEGNLPVEGDFVSAYNSDDSVAANHIAEYLGVELK